MRIALAADHGGVDLKQDIARRLREGGHDVFDHGTHGPSSVDYPDFASVVADALRDGEAERGILVCGTGQGMAMAINKRPGLRAGVVMDAFSARMIVEHNDAQVLCLGARVVGHDLAWTCVQAFLDARFAGGRHERRVHKIEERG